MSRKLTLDEFRLNELRLFPGATGELSNLLRVISIASKRIHAVINKKSPEENDSGELGINASGDTVKKLDQFANEEMINILKGSFSCAGIVSEEEEEFRIFEDSRNCASKYIVVFDPLDGSSNADNCMPVGTIFAIYRRLSPTGTFCDQQDFLQPGKNIYAAGYIIYGSSTMLVYATKRGVNGFTLDNNIGEFCLTHPSIRCPESGKIYSVNESNRYQYSQSIIDFLEGLQRWNAYSPGSYNFKYVGSMVADLHRILLEGGIFMYPATTENRGGKLRLLYECNPFSFIFENAGGVSVNGTQDILDISPTSIHQRCPIYIGSRKIVQMIPRSVGSRYNMT